MRTVKFRLIKDGKIIGYEKWYIGKKHSPDSEMKGYAAQPCWLYSMVNTSWTKTYIFHDTKDQYTGIKDKNGKEIYEGDRIRGYMDYGPGGFVEREVPVHWHNEHGYQWNYFNISSIEIIGNIR